MENKITIGDLLDSHASFDAIYLAKQIAYSKSLDMLVGASGDFIDIGAESIENQFDCEGMLLYLRSNTFSDFRYPVGIMGMANSSSAELLAKVMPFLQNLKLLLSKYHGCLHFVVCDGHKSHFKVYYVYQLFLLPSTRSVP